MMAIAPKESNDRFCFEPEEEMEERSSEIGAKLDGPRFLTEKWTFRGLAFLADGVWSIVGGV